LKEFIASLELSSITRLHPGFMYCLQYNGHLFVWFHEHHATEGNNSGVIYYLLGCAAIGAYVLEQPAT